MRERERERERESMTVSGLYGTRQIGCDRKLMMSDDDGIVLLMDEKPVLCLYIMMVDVISCLKNLTVNVAAVFQLAVLH